MDDISRNYCFTFIIHYAEKMIDLQNLFEKFKLGLGNVREILMWIAEKIADFAQLQSDNVYFIMLIIISIWLGRKIFMIWFTTSEGRWTYWLIISAIIFAILKFL